MKKIIILSIFVLLMVHIATAQLFINEFMAKNTSIVADEFGEYDDWIEIYNAGDVAIDIGGYYVCDKVADFSDYYHIPENNPSQTTISAGGFLMLWADKDTEQGPLHTNFKLSGDGEFIGLFSNTQTLIDSFSFQTQFQDVSSGRAPDGGESIVFFQPATPLASNPANGFLGMIEPPIFNPEGGFYEGSIHVTLTAPVVGGVIYYTTDGSDPDVNSMLYSGAINIHTTTVIRAITVKNGSLTSFPSSNTYFFDDNYALPVFEITTDPDNMWGESGIYSHPFEEGSAWERFCQSSYFIDDEKEFAVNSGIRIQGNSSVGMDKKSFRLFFKNQYGQNKLQYPLFGDNEGVTSFKNIVLKSGYDDDITLPFGTLLRDPIGWRFYKKTGGLVAGGTWSVLTLNGDYWGIYELRESVNKHFIKSHTGFSDFDMIRLGKGSIDVKHGNADAWNELIDFVNSHDLSVEANYQIVCDKMDMDNFINLMAFVQSTDYESWSYGVTAYREQSENGKFKWTVWDMDRSFSGTGANVMEWWNIDTTTQFTWANFLPKALLQNATYRRKFANRQADLLNTIFLSENAIADLQVQKDAIAPEMSHEIARWNPELTMSEWEYNVGHITYFLQYRPHTVRQDIVEFYNLSGTRELELDVVGHGSLHINTIDVPEYPWSGIYFKGVPVTITAVPDAGYRFTGWNHGALDDDETTITVDVAIYDDIIAHFEEITGGDCSGVVVDEIMYHPSSENTGGEWVELYNTSGESKDISGWILKDDKDVHAYVIPDGTSIPPNEFLVIAEDVEEFSNFYTDVDNVIGNFGAGNGGFGLSNSGDEVRLFAASGCLVDEAVFVDTIAQSAMADGGGRSLYLPDVMLDNSAAENWEASAIVNGMPGRENTLVVNIGNDKTVCSGATVVLNALVPGCTDCEFEWSNGNLTAINEVVVNETTTFTVNVTSGEATASASLNISVNVEESPHVVVENVSASCYQESTGAINISVSGGVAPYEYEWNTGEETQDLAHVVADDYTLLVTDANGCQTVLFVTVQQSSKLVVEASTTPVLCFGENNGSVNVTVSGGISPYNYEWNIGLSMEDLGAISAGDYALTVTDANECVATLEVTVSEPAQLTATVLTNSPTSIGSDGSIIVEPEGGTPPYEISWETGDVGFELVNLDEGDYEFTVIDAYGCDYHETTALQVMSEDDFNGIKNIVIFPNPNPGKFTVQWDFIRNDNLIFSLVNTLGQCVWTTEIPSTAGSLTVNLDALNTTILSSKSGLYFLRIITSTDEMSKLLIIR